MLGPLVTKTLHETSLDFKIIAKNPLILIKLPFFTSFKKVKPLQGLYLNLYVGDVEKLVY